MTTIYTKAEIEAEIALWKEAVRELSARRSYTVGDRSLTAVDLPEATKRLGELTAMLARHDLGGDIMVQQIVNMP